MCWKEKFEDNKGVIRRHKWKKDRQHNGKKDKNNDIRNITQKTKLKRTPHLLQIQ